MTFSSIYAYSFFSFHTHFNTCKTSHILCLFYPSWWLGFLPICMSTFEKSLYISHNLNYFFLCSVSGIWYILYVISISHMWFAMHFPISYTYVTLFPLLRIDHFVCCCNYSPWLCRIIVIECMLPFLLLGKCHWPFNWYDI